MQTNGPDYTLRDIRRLLAKAFITHSCGGGKDPFVSVQFAELSDSQRLHEIFAKLARSEQ